MKPSDPVRPELAVPREPFTGADFVVHVTRYRDIIEVTELERAERFSSALSVQRVAPTAVPWLQLHTGQRGVFPSMATPTGVPTLSPPTTTASGFPTGGGAAVQQVHADDQHVAFTTTDAAPGPGEAHAYRVTANQAGAVFGGYTVVLLG